MPVSLIFEKALARDKYSFKIPPLFALHVYKIGGWLAKSHQHE